MTRVIPLLVNQFTRLLEMGPRFYKPGTRWHNVVNGHDYDSENCMAAGGSIAAAIQSGFSRTFSPGDIRNHQDDFSGGIGVDDVQVALARLGLPKIITTPTDWPGVIQWVREGRLVILAVQYSKVPRPVQAQKGGTFDHMLAVCNLYADGTIDLYDPLAVEIQRVEQSSVRPAAEAIALRERGDATRLFVGATNILPLVGPTLRYGGRPVPKGQDRTRALGVHGSSVNVHSRPTTGTASVVGQLPTGALFIAYQLTTGDPFEGSRIWYGDKTGTRWIAAKRLSHIGGST